MFVKIKIHNGLDIMDNNTGVCLDFFFYNMFHVVITSPGSPLTFSLVASSGQHFNLKSDSSCYASPEN